MTLAEKLRQVRIRENLTQAQMADLVGLSLNSYKNYELAKRLQISALALLKITTHPTFTKYTLWLMAGQVAPEAGQVSPV